ncbi:MAG: ribonuclease HII [Rhizobiales bacterium]|nr:ribonuclease HII [Hyphomicrobiales bacterium]
MPQNRRRNPAPDLSFERALSARGLQPVAGIDEAGRGPIAGPVVAAAVILDQHRVPEGIRDSKELSPAKRDALFDNIMQSAEIGIGIAPVERIDADNILQATLWAMAQAANNLTSPPATVIVDGNQLPQLSCPCEAIIGGDRKSLSIAAASIIAKVTRDRMMEELARAFPQYGFERHRGYPTKAHIASLNAHGPCPHHRRSFGPVAATLR